MCCRYRFPRVFLPHSWPLPQALVRWSFLGLRIRSAFLRVGERRVLIASFGGHDESFSLSLSTTYVTNSLRVSATREYNQQRNGSQFVVSGLPLRQSILTENSFTVSWSSAAFAVPFTVVDFSESLDDDIHDKEVVYRSFTRRIHLPVRRLESTE